jgi:hypothetical protein
MPQSEQKYGICVAYPTPHRCLAPAIRWRPVTNDDDQLSGAPHSRVITTRARTCCLYPGTWKILRHVNFRIYALSAGATASGPCSLRIRWSIRHVRGHVLHDADPQAATRSSRASHSRAFRVAVGARDGAAGPCIGRAA